MPDRYGINQSKLKLFLKLAAWQIKRHPLQLIRILALAVISPRRDTIARLSAWANDIPSLAAAPEYAKWRDQFDRLSHDTIENMRKRQKTLRHRPLFSIIMPTYQSNIGYLTEAIESVQNQIYDNWELCIADDASPNPDVKAVLTKYAHQDPRIKLAFREQNGNISAASNTALSLAKGDFIALMDHDDLIPAHSLYLVAKEIEKFPDVDIIFTDEDKIDEKGIRYSPHFKLGWNREILLHQNMVNHLGIYRTSLVRKVGGFRTGLEGSQDHDLALRVSEQTIRKKIRHIPKILYHWRVFQRSGSFSATNGDRAVKAAIKAVSDHLTRTGEPALVTASNQHSCDIHIVRQVQKTRPSIAICGLGAEITLENLRRLKNEFVEALPDIQIIRGQNARLIAHRTNADMLLLVDQFAYPLQDNWLDLLVAQLQAPNVGAVGPSIIDGNGIVVQSPLHQERDGKILFPHQGKLWASPGYFGRMHIPQECTALERNFLLTRREHVLQTNALLDSSVSVTAYCRTLAKMNLLNVWDPRVVIQI